MGLEDIAAGVETTTQQRERGVAVVDATDGTLAERLAPVADRLPCSAGAAATVAEEYARGASVGAAAEAAGVAPVTAAKALHRCGVAGVCPLPPTGREVVRDWLDARLSRADAVALAGGSEEEFALATYVETHDPVPEAAEAVECVLSAGAGGSATGLAGTLDDAGPG